MKKRFVLLIVMFMITVCFNSVICSAQTYSGICGALGDNVTWELDEEGTLTISGSGDICDYSGSEAPYYGYSSSIHEIIIEPGVTGIGRAAFNSLKYVTNVTIPDTVSEIGSSAFAYCDRLLSVFIPNSVISIGDDAFLSCRDMTAIDVAENNPSYSSLDGVLFNKDKTEIIRYPMGGNDSYTIPDSVTRIRKNAFAALYTRSMTSVVIPDSVTSIGNSAFSNNENLTSIVLPNSITQLGDLAFANCKSLTNVVIPESVVSIGMDAFRSCESLTGITIPANVTSIGTCAFSGCTNMMAIDVSENNAHYSSQDGVLFDKNKTALIMCPCGKSGEYMVPEGVTAIRTQAFNKCGFLTSVKISNQVTDINSSAFFYCEGLEVVTLPHSLERISYLAFAYCTNLCEIRFDGTEEEWDAVEKKSNWDQDTPTNKEIYCNYSGTCGKEGDNITWNLDINGTLTLTGSGEMADYYDMVSAPWYERRNLIDKVIITPGVTYIGALAFGESNLTCVTLPDSLISIGDGAFYCCFSLQSIVLPNGLTSIGGYGFHSCSDLKNVVLPDSVTSIGEGAFSYCSNLNDVILSDNLTSISDRAFSDCRSLNSVVLPDSITSIGNAAFSSCYNLNTVVLPDTLTSIGSNTFESCSKLMDIFYQGTKNEWDAVEKGLDWCSGTPEALTIHYILSGTCGAEGDNLTWILDTDGTLTITGNGEMDDFSDSSPWADECDLIEKVIIGPDVTSIGMAAFNDCYNLETVTIPDSVTRIGESAFGYCYALKSVSIPYGVTSIENFTFFECESLEQVVIPVSVTSIGKVAFYYCDSMTDIWFEGTEDQWNAIEKAADWYAESSENLTVHYSISFKDPDFVLPTDVSIIDESAFEGVPMTVVFIPDDCTAISDHAFKDCIYLTQIRIPENCTIAENAFDGCGEIVIFGKSGSEAEAFCNLEGHGQFTFIAEQ